MRRHLAGCDECGARKEELQGPLTDAMLAVYLDATSLVPHELPQSPRDAFVRWLAAQPVSLGVPPSRSPRFSVLAGSWTRSLHPAPAATLGLVVLLAGAACLTWWPRRNAPQLSPDTLLVRAEKLERLENTAASGAVRQAVLIKAGSHALKRSLYWDTRGKRHPKPVDWTGSHDPLGSALTAAGLDWDRPISASAYEVWRKHQRLSAESVTRSAHLLTVTTTVAEGIVAAESLTLRESDLHAVARTVDVRGRGTVEIAEVDYTVLPWTAVPAAAFEPLEPSAGVPDARSAERHPALTLRDPPDADQLDRTELEARLILNQWHADAGEQIEIRRTPQWVEVSGLIEEDERRRQLCAALGLVPRLKVSIVSASELRSAPASGPATVSVSDATLPDHPSALEAYLAAQGWDVAARNALAQQLFAGTLTITRECKALAELDARFPDAVRMPMVESATLAELRYSHHERLSAALRQERLLLVPLRGPSQKTPSNGAAAPAGARPLTELAEDNLALVRELTQTNTPAPRNAEVLFQEMATRIDELAVASQWQGTPGTNNTAHQNQSTELPQ